MAPVFATCITEYRPSDPKHEVYMGYDIREIDNVRRQRAGQGAMFHPIQELNYPWHQILDACASENNCADWEEGLRCYFEDGEVVALLYVSDEPFPLEPPLKLIRSESRKD